MRSVNAVSRTTLCSLSLDGGVTPTFPKQVNHFFLSNQSGIFVVIIVAIFVGIWAGNCVGLLAFWGARLGAGLPQGEALQGARQDVPAPQRAAGAAREGQDSGAAGAPRDGADRRGALGDLRRHCLAGRAPL